LQTFRNFNFSKLFRVFFSEERHRFAFNQQPVSRIFTPEFQ